MSGLYIHIPFCLKKCLYCDFYSITDQGLIPAFLAALFREMDSAPPPPGPFDTVFLGGGTPSLLTPAQVASILDRAASRFGMTQGAEVTLEANPGTLAPALLKDYALAGVNRMSLGVQSFDDGLLAFLGRLHGGAQGRDILEAACKAGFAGVSCDLIYAVPGQTPASWRRDMETALALGPDHLSCYMLTIESNTPLGRLVRQGETAPMEEGGAGGLFLETDRFLTEKGFLHYEISNFARTPSAICRHNLGYWNHSPYLGLGPAAHSFTGVSRRWNVASVREYCSRLDKGLSPVLEEETLDRTQHMLEWLYLGLRQARGVDLAAFGRRFDADFVALFASALSGLQDQGMLRDIPGRCALTPGGMLLSDGVCRLLARCLD